MSDNEISKERLAKIVSTGEFTYYGWPQKLVVEEAVKMARELQRVRYGMPADDLASRHQEPGVKVKPLEWSEDDEALTPFGTYRIERTEDGYALTFNYEELVHIGFNAVASFQSPRLEALGYAQPDYEQRILSALTKQEGSATLSDTAMESGE